MKEPVIPRQIKIMVVGPSKSGKSSIINSFINYDENNPSNLPKIDSTNMVDILFKKMRISDKIYINVIS